MMMEHIRSAVQRRQDDSRPRDKAKTFYRSRPGVGRRYRMRYTARPTSDPLAGALLVEKRPDAMYEQDEQGYEISESQTQAKVKLLQSRRP